MPNDASASAPIRGSRRFGLRAGAGNALMSACGVPCFGVAAKTAFRPRAGGLVLCLFFVSFFSGCGIPTTVRALCGPYEECKRMEALRLAAALQSRRVWIDCYAEQYAEESESKAFRQGFERAYIETVQGADGCPPPVPSRPLLSWQTLTFSYPDADAWYAGYHLGHASALANGVDRWRLAPIDPSLRGMETVGERGSVVRIPEGGASRPDGPTTYGDDPELEGRETIPSEPIELLVPPADPDPRGSRIDL